MGGGDSLLSSIRAQVSRRGPAWDTCGSERSPVREASRAEERSDRGRAGVVSEGQEPPKGMRSLRAVRNHCRISSRRMRSSDS